MPAQITVYIYDSSVYPYNDFSLCMFFR